MAGVTPRPSPIALARTLAALPVHVARVHVTRSAVPLPDYPGEPRPSSTVELSGFGVTGYGENVAFYGAEHELFVERIAAWFRDLTERDELTGERAVENGELTVERALAGAELPRYERAALEAALIDLALRQTELGLYDLTGLREAELRFVASLSGGADPLAAITRLRAAGFVGELKLDLDERWSDATLHELGRDPRLVILDFKGRGSAEFARRAANAVPHALLEDPPHGAEIPARRVSRDATIESAADAEAAFARGEWVNLKAPRMGGVLELLRALELCRDRAYFGGMFEVGVGREQARALAAIYGANAPNDLALNRGTLGSERAVENSPAAIDFGFVGFSADGERRNR